eukprot:scaffold136707_cov27-Tisochrysis_lutea.AAC.2
MLEFTPPNRRAGPLPSSKRALTRGLSSLVAGDIPSTAGMCGVARSTSESTRAVRFVEHRRTLSSSGTAGAMKSVWKAPATASLTAMRALKSGFALAHTASTASIAPEHA